MGLEQILPETSGWGQPRQHLHSAFQPGTPRERVPALSAACGIFSGSLRKQIHTPRGARLTWACPVCPWVPRSSASSGTQVRQLPRQDGPDDLSNLPSVRPSAPTSVPVEGRCPAVSSRWGRTAVGCMLALRSPLPRPVPTGWVSAPHHSPVVMSITSPRELPAFNHSRCDLCSPDPAWSLPELNLVE